MLLSRSHGAWKRVEERMQAKLVLTPLAPMVEPKAHLWEAAWRAWFRKWRERETAVTRGSLADGQQRSCGGVTVSFAA